MAALHFHWIDLVVVAVVLASAIFAVYRGFVAESLSIFAWAAAAFATLYFAPSAAPLLSSAMSPVMAQLVAYVVVFLVVLIPLSFLSARFAENVRNSAVGPLDRSLGAIFGVVRGLIVLTLAYILFSLMVPPKKQPEWITQAATLPLIEDTSDVVLTVIPRRGGPATHEAPPADNSRVEVRELPKPRAKPGTEEAANGHGRTVKKSYGAKDRQGLDSLIKTTSGGGKKP